MRSPARMGIVDMNDVFPSVATVSIKDAEAGSIVAISRSGGSVLALLTDHLTNGVRSIVLLNAKIQDGSSVIFAENWRNEESALRYSGSIRFELGMSDNDVDARGNKSWETPGVIISIEDDLFIRAAPQDPFYGSYKLVSIRTGAVFPNQTPNNAWSFLSWQLWIRDAVADRD